MRTWPVILCLCVFPLVFLQSITALGDTEDGIGNAQREGEHSAGEPAPSHSEDVAFTAEVDGSVQRYVVMLPEGFQDVEVHDVLIAFHGHGSDRWQFIRDPRPECRAARDVAALHEMIFVSPDYRAKTSWMGPAAEVDTVQVIRDLKSRYRIGKIFLCGGSMGGTACLTFAVLHPDLVSGVASMNGTANLVEYENFQEAIRTSYGGGQTDVPEEYRKRSAEFFPERLTMPVGLTAGGKDNVVPADSILRLSEVLKKREGKVLLLYRENGGHETNYDDALEVLKFTVQDSGIETRSKTQTGKED